MPPPPDCFHWPLLDQVGATFAQQLANPFYDNGPNDKGIAIQLAHSLGRVGLGSPANFRAQFQRVAGVSPSAYRAGLGP